jgi:hypothetical protein
VRAAIVTALERLGGGRLSDGLRAVAGARAEEFVMYLGAEAQSRDLRMLTAAMLRELRPAPVRGEG